MTARRRTWTRRRGCRAGCGSWWVHVRLRVYNRVCSSGGWKERMTCSGPMKTGGKVGAGMGCGGANDSCPSPRKTETVGRMVIVRARCGEERRERGELLSVSPVLPPTLHVPDPAHLTPHPASDPVPHRAVPGPARVRHREPAAGQHHHRGAEGGGGGQHTGGRAGVSGGGGGGCRARTVGLCNSACLPCASNTSKLRCAHIPLDPSSLILSTTQPHTHCTHAHVHTQWFRF